MLILSLKDLKPPRNMEELKGALGSKTFKTSGLGRKSQFSMVFAFFVSWSSCPNGGFLGDNRSWYFCNSLWFPTYNYHLISIVVNTTYDLCFTYDHQALLTTGLLSFSNVGEDVRTKHCLAMGFCGDSLSPAAASTLFFFGGGFLWFLLGSLFRKEQHLQALEIAYSVVEGMTFNHLRTSKIKYIQHIETIHLWGKLTI